MKNSTALILLLLSLGLFYAFTDIQYREVKALYALAGEYRNVLQNISAVIGLRDQLLVGFEAFPRAEIDRVNKVLPDNLDTVRLALDLDAIASRYGIALKNIQVSTSNNETAGAIVLPEYGDTYGKATVAFSFVSTYSNFKSLLADLEKNLRIMDIRSVSFQASESGLYDYQMSVETYWLK